MRGRTKFDRAAGIAAPSALAALLSATLASACGAPEPRTANPTRVLDERRAIQIIEEAFREEKDTPVPGGRIALSAEHSLEIDVQAQGKRYGVAYVTGHERVALGAALAPRDLSMGEDALQLMSGVGEDGDARVLILRDNDYVYDALSGSGEPSKSTIAAELKLHRDVRDFLIRAHSANWP